jgi:hypothetical protein
MAAFAAPGDPPSYAEAFNKAFDPSYALEVDDAADGTTPEWEHVSFHTLDMGKVTITTGRIAACDPFVFIDTPHPYAQAVPNGDFPVRLAVVSGSLSDGRIAFARVDFASAPAVSWRMAVTEGQDLAKLKPDHIYGYGVDAGTGSFFDPAAGDAALKLLNANENAWEKWQADGERNGKNARLKPNFFLNLPMPPGNIVMFASGWGDGFYASWFGYDAKGNVVALVTDFQVIAWERARN